MGYQKRDHWVDIFEGRKFDATTSISKVFTYLCPMEVAFTSEHLKGRSLFIAEVVATNESSRNPEDALQSYFEGTKLVSFHVSFLLLNYTLKRQTNFPLFTEVMKQKVRVAVTDDCLCEMRQKIISWFVCFRARQEWDGYYMMELN